MKIKAEIVNGKRRIIIIRETSIADKIKEVDIIAINSIEI